MYDVIKIAYCQTTQDAKDNISKLFDREYICVLGENKILIKLGGKLYTVASLVEVV